MLARFFSIIILLSSVVLPCAVCYGALNDPMANGMNNAILFLLGVIGFLLLSIIGTTVYFNYRTKTLK